MVGDVVIRDLVELKGELCKCSIVESQVRSV